MNDKELVLLNAISPLDKKTKNKIWRNISNELELGLIGKIKKIFKLWYVLFLFVSMAIFTSLSPNASTTILNANDTGWEAVLENQKLSIKAVSPMIVGKTEVCVLWIKKDGHIFKITELPDGGIKNISLDKTMVANFKHATVMISIENKTHISLPKKIEYMRHL